MVVMRCEGAAVTPPSARSAMIARFMLVKGEKSDPWCQSDDQG
jgi:hypothetical protein